MNKLANIKNRFAYLPIPKTLLAVSCLFLIAFTSFQAHGQNSFSGSLNVISITGSDGSNSPPTAVFEFTKNDNIVNFDASKSVDIDGNIVEYFWDFGDSATGSGSIISHQFNNASASVTLKIIDDKGGVSISQRRIYIATLNSGNEVQATSVKEAYTGRIWAYKLPSVPDHNGILKSISITADGLGKDRRFKLALYTHDQANNLPGDLVADSITVEGVAGGNQPQLVTLKPAQGSPQITSGTQYWVAFETIDSYFRFYRDYNTSHTLAFKNIPTYNWDQWGGKADGVLTYSVGQCFFTYEVAQ